MFVTRAFSADVFLILKLGALPQANLSRAPLALNTHILLKRGVINCAFGESGIIFAAFGNDYGRARREADSPV